MKVFHENRKRSFAKMISWRVVATLTTTIVVFFFTGEFALAVGVGVFDALLKLVFYYAHERAWNKSMWERDKGF